MYLTFVIVSVILIVLIYTLSKNMLNPLIIYNVLWLFIVSLYFLRLIPYYQTLNETWYVIIIAPMIMTLGYTTIHIAFFKRNFRYKLNLSNITYIKFFLMMFGTLLVIRTISVWSGIYLHYGSFLAAFTHGDDIYNLSRSGQWGPGIGFYMPVDFFSMFFVGIYHKMKGKLDTLSSIIIISNLLMDIALQGRFALLMTFTIYFAAYMGTNRCILNIKVRSLLKYLLFGITLIMMISSDRNLATINHVSGNWGEYSSTVLPSIYFYLTNGIAGLNEYIRLGHDKYNTLYTFSPLLRFYSIFDSHINVPIYETTYYYTPVRTIIATWLKYVIHDFGFIGMGIMLYFAGAILKYSELKLKSKLSIFWLSIYTHITAMLILSFFGYALFISSFWYSLIGTMIMGLLIDSGEMRNVLSKYIKTRYRKKI